MSDFYEIDFSDWGYREQDLAFELLSIYRKNPHAIDNDGLKVCFNANSGYVFLSDENYRVWMESDGKLEEFYSCSECGHEGFTQEFQDQECRECKRIFLQGYFSDDKAKCQRCHCNTDIEELLDNEELLCNDCIYEENNQEETPKDD